MLRTRSGRSVGFSLIELLIAVTILGAIAGGIYGIYDTSAHNARVNTMRSQRRAIKNAIEQYYSQRGNYPPTLLALTKRYLNEIPDDPLTSFQGCDWLVRGPSPTASWVSSIGTSGPAGGVFDARSASGL